MGKFIGRDISIGIGKEKVTGTADETEANKLHDADGEFTSDMVGALVTNTTDYTYSFVSAYVDSGELTLEDDIFESGETYEVCVRGTQIAPAFWLPLKSLDIGNKVLMTTDEQTYGVIEDAIGAEIVSKWAEGSIEGIVRDKTIGLLFLNMLGAISSTPYAGADAAVYKHVFTVRSGHVHPAFTLATNDPLEDKSFPLAMLKTLSIKADLGEKVLFSSDVLSKPSVASDPALTPAYVAENEFKVGDIEAKFAATTADLDAATATKIKSVEVTIDQGVEKDDVLSSTSPDDIVNKEFKIELSVKKNHDSTTFEGYFTDATSRAMRITITNSGTTIGATKHPKINIDLNKVQITDWNKTVDLNGVVTEEFTLKAMFKIADSEMVEITLENLQTNY